MDFQLSCDIGADLLARRGDTQFLYYKQRFDFSAAAVLGQGYSLSLFTVPNDTYATGMVRVRVVFPQPAMAAYWRSGIAINGSRCGGSLDLDFTTGEYTEALSLAENGLLPAELQGENFEVAYLARPGEAVTLSLIPVTVPHVNPAMNPVGTVTIAGVRLKGKKY